MDILPNEIFITETSLIPGPQEGGLIQFDVWRKKVLGSRMRNERFTPNPLKKFSLSISC